MKIIKSLSKLSLREMKRSALFVGAVKTVMTTSKIFEIAHDEQSVGEMVMIPEKKFRQILAVDPTKSLVPLVTEIEMEMVSASLRSEEIYRMVLGKSIFFGNDNYSSNVYGSGFERKILREGTNTISISQNKISLGSSITATYPLLGPVVSVKKPGATLQVVGGNAKLGVVDLLDADDLEIADGTAVEVNYQTTRHAVVMVKDRSKKRTAVILARGLYDYLLAHA